MWILKRVPKGDFKATDDSTYHLIVGEYVVGRKECQIKVLGDQTVSRKHANITVNEKADPSVSLAQVSLKDVSKFGTFINGVKCKNSAVVPLKHGDIITFGSFDSRYRLNHEPLVACTSRVEITTKKMLKAQIAKLGGCLVNDWQKECTHLVMASLTFTMKVIYALAACCPIVHPSYFEDLLVRMRSKAELPLAEQYLPRIKEDLIDPRQVSFQPNAGRKSIFSGKRFVFLAKNQFKVLSEAIHLAGGTALLKESGNIPDDDDLLTDANTLIMAVNLNPGISADRQMWIGHVWDVLSSNNRRTIPETEVGLAILYLSVEEYCNPNLNRVPRVTKRIVSKSLSTMEAMSQRTNESQNGTVMPIPDKKPFATRPTVDESSQPQSSTSDMMTPQVTRKRSRGSSSDLQPLVDDTPLSQVSSSETKRRKLPSPVSDITHISQTDHSEPEDGVVDVCSRDTSGTGREESDAQKLSLKPTSQDQPLKQEESFGFSMRSPDLNKRRGSSVPAAEITTIPESQQSEIKREPREIRGNAARDNLGRNVTSVKTEKFLEPESHWSEFDTKNDDIFFDDKNKQERPIGMKFGHSSTASPSRKRRTELTVPRTNLTEVSSTPEAQIRVKVEKSPLPELEAKRLKLWSGDKDVLRNNGYESPAENFSRTEESSFLPPASPKMSASKISVKEEIQDSVSTCVATFRGKRENRGFQVNAGQLGTDATSGTEFSDCLVDTNCNLGKSAVVVDSHEKHSSVTVFVGDGWLSKKLPREKRDEVGAREELKTDRSEEDGFRVGRDVDGDSSRGVETLEGRKEFGQVLIKQEVDNGDCRDVTMTCEHVNLVVRGNVTVNVIQERDQIAYTTLKNKKTFRKQNYAGNGPGLPRIIGGSDLQPYFSRVKDVEDWFQKVQQMNRERDVEDEAADNLFRYEPSKKNRR